MRVGAVGTGYEAIRTSSASRQHHAKPTRQSKHPSFPVLPLKTIRQLVVPVDVSAGPIAFRAMGVGSRRNSALLEVIARKNRTLTGVMSLRLLGIWENSRSGETSALRVTGG